MFFVVIAANAADGCVANIFSKTAMRVYGFKELCIINQARNSFAKAR